MSTNVSKVLRRKVWEKEFGLQHANAICPLCQTQQISVWDFQCGHVISRKHNGETTLDNLRPICILCNMSMSSKDWYVFEHELYPYLNKKRSQYDFMRKKTQHTRIQYNWDNFLV